MFSPEKKLNNILKEIRLSENRESADGMERMGLYYQKNFGVGLLQLREIAKRYKPDRELAKLLRKKKFRETLILSFMIDDTDLILSNDFKDIYTLISTQELAEQFVLNILEKDKRFYPQIDLLLNSQKEFLISAGFVLISRIALIDKETEDAFFEQYLKKAAEFSENESIYVRKSVARALRQTALRNNTLRSSVLHYIQLIKENNNSLSSIVFEEVVPLI